jgi:hypothetical protein
MTIDGLASITHSARLNDPRSSYTAILANTTAQGASPRGLPSPQLMPFAGDSCPDGIWSRDAELLSLECSSATVLRS